MSMERSVAEVMTPGDRKSTWTGRVRRSTPGCVPASDGSIPSVGVTCVFRLTSLRLGEGSIAESSTVSR